MHRRALWGLDLRMHTHNWARTAGQNRGRCMQTKQLVMQVSHKWVALEGLEMTAGTNVMLQWLRGRLLLQG